MLPPPSAPWGARNDFQRDALRNHRRHPSCWRAGATAPGNIPANRNKISAEFKDGVLTVHLTKTEKAKPQQIEVNVGSIGARPPTGNNLMNALAHWNQSRWNQLNELEDLRHALGRLFSGPGVHRPEEDAGAPEWIPVVNVSEDAHGYVIKAELPQVKKEDVKIRMEDGTLTITGARKFDQNSKKDHPLPLACGRFVHCFAVPSDARPTRVSAVFANEILTVHVARDQKARVRRAERELV